MQQSLTGEFAHNLPKPIARKWKLLLCAAVVAALWGIQHVPLYPDGSIAGVGDICLFRNLTGLPCPLCGMTRSLLCFFQGNWHASLLWHPLGPLLGISAVIGFLTWMFPSPISKLATKLPQRLCGIFILLLFLSFWALRLAGVFPLPLSP